MSLRSNVFLRSNESCGPAWGRLLSSGSSDSAGDADNDELLAFLEEDAEASTPKEVLVPWVLLIVDDEPQVHEATTLTLRRGRVANRPFHFLHAHSAAEAKEIICSEAHIDLVLLDVMMETRDAGFKLIQELRGPLGLTKLKILIRSGQPGAEQEHTIAQRHPVEGYMQKTQQTYSLMMEVIHNILLGTNPDQGSAN